MPSGGLVGIIANDSARYSLFAASVTRLDLPDGWRVEWLIGGDWCAARNELARATLDGGYSHLWFMDDDHAFAPDLLTNLLRWDQPLVTPLCLTRTYPFQPVNYLKDGPLDYASVPSEGLVELHTGGAAGMLIRRDVLEAIPEPWFEYTDRSEDVLFCEKAIEAGFPLYADLEARLGHITTTVVSPVYDDEHGWMTGLWIGSGFTAQIPLAGDLINRDISRVVVAAPPEAAPAKHVRAVEDVPVRPVSAVPVEDDVFERAELWFDEDEQRFYARLLHPTGAILYTLGPFAREHQALERLDRFNVPVFHIRDHLDDSRRERKGPPLRLWDYSPVKGHLS